MKLTVTCNRFVNAFHDLGRAEDMGGSAHLDELYTYFTALEDDIGYEIELDVIAICCDWAWYETAEEAAADFGLDLDAYNGDGMEALHDYTDAWKCTDGTVYVRAF